MVVTKQNKLPFKTSLTYIDILCSVHGQIIVIIGLNYDYNIPTPLRNNRWLDFDHFFACTLLFSIFKCPVLYTVLFKPFFKLSRSSFMLSIKVHFLQTPNDVKQDRFRTGFMTAAIQFKVHDLTS